jgi:predicted ATPase
LPTAVAHRLKLAPVPAHFIPDLIRQQLDVNQLSPALEQFIQEKGGGHPLFTLALSHTMQQTKLLRIAKDEAHLSKQVHQKTILPLPSLIQRTITHSLDRLPATHELLLKRASTLNTTFTYHDLKATYTQTADTHQLPRQLDELVTLGLLQCENGSAPTYRFSHQLSREAVNNLLVSEQRTALTALIGNR